MRTLPYLAMNWNEEQETFIVQHDAFWKYVMMPC
jgi:hypothetical protein